MNWTARARRVIVAGSVLALAALVIPLPAAAAATAYAAKSSNRAAVSPVTTYTVQQDIWITSHDGTRLSANAFVPNTCPCPVIVTQTPYRKSTSPDAFIPTHGYVEVVVDVRGTGSSEGYWSIFGPDEQKDGADVVKWAAAQPWSNGIVGTYGGSYLGINQLLTAEQNDPEMTTHLKALFPIIPMSDSYRDVTWSGGGFDSAFMPWWLALVHGESLEPADYAQNDPAVALNVESQHAMDVAQMTAVSVPGGLLGAYEHQICASGVPLPQCTSYPDEAYDNPAYRASAPITNIGRITQPTFVVGGEYDIFQRGEPLIYRGLNLPTSQKKLVLGPWYHVTAGKGLGGGVTDQLGNPIPTTDALALAWFDHWLKGYDNGIDAFPTVETYALGAGRWIANSSFPMQGANYTNFFLDAAASGSNPGSLSDGSLASRPGADFSFQLPWLPANEVCSQSTSQWLAGLDQLAASRHQCDTQNNHNERQALTFTTPAMSRAMVLSGPMNAILYTQSNRTDTAVQVFVTDVAPDGTSTELTSGALIASQRAINPTRCGAVVNGCSVYQGGSITQPWHPYTYASQAPLDGSSIYELQIEVFPTTAVVRTGHRLRVVITSGDTPHRADTASTVGDSAGALDNIYMGSAHPSRLYAGIVPLNAAGWAYGL